LALEQRTREYLRCVALSTRFAGRIAGVHSANFGSAFNLRKCGKNLIPSTVLRSGPGAKLVNLSDTAHTFWVTSDRPDEGTDSIRA
jgi:hypothetical protein